MSNKKKWLVTLSFGLLISTLTTLKMGCSKTMNPSACLTNPTWHSVDKTMANDTQSALARQITLAKDGFGFAAGVSVTNTRPQKISHWRITRTQDGGKTWHESDDYRYPVGLGGASATGVARGPGNRVYAVGSGITDLRYKRWVVRASQDLGLSWNTVDDFHVLNNADAEAFAVTIDTDGNPVVAGSAGIDGRSTRWLIRKSDDGGVTWRTLDNFAYAGQNYSAAANIALDDSGALYAVGVGTDGIRKHWLVKSSQDDGETWTVNDDFQYATVQDSEAIAFASDREGRLFVTGRVKDNLGKFRWLTRLSQDRGATWTTVDDFSPITSKGASPESLVVDETGRIFVVGNIAGPNGETHGILRASFDQGASWQIMPSPSTGFELSGLAWVAPSQLFFSGVAKSSDSMGWLVSASQCR